MDTTSQNSSTCGSVSILGPIAIEPKVEQVFTYPEAEKILTQVYETVDGSVKDMTVAFDDASKYNQQSASETAIGNGILSLKKTNKWEGTSVQFDGKTAYAEVSYDPLYAPADQIMAEVLAYEENWNTTKYMDIISKTENSGYALGTNGPVFGSGYMGFGVYRSGYKCAKTSLQELTPGWHRFSGSYDGRYVKFYVDGKLKDTNDLGSVKPIPYVKNSLIIGSDVSGSTGSGGLYFDGRISDVRLWNVIPSDEDIAAHAFTRLTGSESGLAGYWKMDEGSGNILYNSTENKLNATLHYAYTWVTDDSSDQGQYPMSPYYASTTSNSNFNLAEITEINFLTVPVTTPEGTSVKMLYSVDNRQHWLYNDANSVPQLFTGDITQEWTNFNTNSDLQTYFSNRTLAQLTADLSALGITPVSLDFCWQLETTDSSATPTVSNLTMNVSSGNGNHLEGADVGSFADSNSLLGLKILSPTHLVIKNKDTTNAHTLTVYVTAVTDSQ